MKGFEEPSRIGKFQGVQFDVHVIHAAGVQRREQVLHGREQHALFHQAGGVADACNVAHVRFDFEIVQVHAAKNDAGIGRSRNQSQVAANRRVETDALRVSTGLCIVS